MIILILSSPYSVNFGNKYPQIKKANNIVMLIQNNPVALAKGEYPETLMVDGNAKEKLNWVATKNIEDYIKTWLEENKNV